jgi:hypothetical protein
MAVCAVSRCGIHTGYFGELRSLDDLAAGFSLGDTRPASDLQDVLPALFPTCGETGGTRVRMEDHLVESIDSAKMHSLRESVGPKQDGSYCAK